MSNVVVTGMGVVSTAGHSLEEFWSTLSACKVTYGGIEEFKNNRNYRITIGARINDQSWLNGISEEFLNKYGKASNYAISAACSAMKDAGLKSSDLPAGRCAVCMGTTMGEIQVEEQLTEIYCRMGAEAVPPGLPGKYETDRIGSAVREATGSTGPVHMVPAACAAGNYAIALGMQLINLGEVDVAIVGGVDVFSRVAFTGFQRLLSLAPDLCRPFDRNRKGLVVGEGCGILILENTDHAKARGARSWGNISGIGLTSDRYHMTAPHPEGDGAVRAMNIALNDARLPPCSIDYISAHGTGTTTNDRIEAKALVRIFGNDALPPVSSIKSMLGHAMGAASALELIASLQMMEYGILLPTVNYSEPDPECELDCVPNVPRSVKAECILSNSFAFGGQVGSLIARKGW